MSNHLYQYSLHLDPLRMRTRLQCDLTVEQFMSWTAGELRVFAIGHKGRKKNQPFVYKYRQILAPYDRLIAQLIAEVRHGGLHDTHETRRRKSYAGEVLDRFVSEFEGYTESEATFRSKVLTPILQRQLIGITDAYMIPTRRAIACGDGDPTIAQVTSFYLGVDPTDPRLIPQYRFNMAFIPEMRWHLATVLDVIKVGSFDSYNKIRCADQDTLLAAIKENAAYLPRRRLPILEEAMIHVLEMEGIDTFFREEIEHAVRIPKLCPMIRLTSERSEKPGEHCGGKHTPRGSTPAKACRIQQYWPSGIARTHQRSTNQTSLPGWRRIFARRCVA